MESSSKTKSGVKSKSKSNSIYNVKDGKQSSREYDIVDLKYP